MVCPSAAGNMEIFGPQQCHPKCFLLLDLQQREQSSVEQPSVHGQGKDEEHTDMGFKWNSWLKNPYLLTTPLGPGAVCGVQCKILLMNTSSKPISGLYGKKTGPILLKPLCLHMELRGFGPWCLFLTHRKLIWRKKHSLQDIKQHLGLNTFAGGKEWGFIPNKIFLTSQFWGTLSYNGFQITPQMSLWKFICREISMNKDGEDQSSFEAYCMCHRWSIDGKKGHFLSIWHWKNLPRRIKKIANIFKNAYLFWISQFCLNLMSSVSNALIFLIFQKSLYSVSKKNLFCCQMYKSVENSPFWLMLWKCPGQGIADKAWPTKQQEWIKIIFYITFYERYDE